LAERPRRRARWRIVVRAAVLALMASVTPGHAVAQQIEVPAELQYTLLIKTLTFDRNLEQRVGAELVIGLVYQTGFIPSRDFARSMIAAVAASPIHSINGIPIRFEQIELSDVGTLGRTLRERGVDIAYLAPLRAVSLDRVLAEARQAGASTAAAVAGQVDEGVAMGIGLRGGKPHIRINLTAAKSERSDFDASLLALAEVVR
jgi:sugar phosphate isomerase/epimerase